MSSGIAPSEGPRYLGKCNYCGEDIYTDMEHWEMHDGILYCSMDCLLEDLECFHFMGVTD